MNQYKYKAFISYRHQPFDKKVAEKLVQMLESYRLPKNLNLQAEKMVICSPDLKDSKWCAEKIK